jgi:hypothetical protein
VDLGRRLFDRAIAERVRQDSTGEPLAVDLDRRRRAPSAVAAAVSASTETTGSPASPSPAAARPGSSSDDASRCTVSLPVARIPEVGQTSSMRACDLGTRKNRVSKSLAPPATIACTITRSPWWIAVAHSQRPLTRKPPDVDSPRIDSPWIGSPVIGSSVPVDASASGSSCASAGNLDRSQAWSTRNDSVHADDTDP